MLSTFDYGISAAQAATLAAVLHPPHCAVQVGTSQMLSGFEGPLAALRAGLLIDALSDGVAQRSEEEASGWRRISACVAAAPGERAVVCANTPRMTTFLSEEALRGVWPHARGLRTEIREASTVDGVLADAGDLTSPNWLLVECHPALEVLRGATSVLRTVQVLWVAVALQLPPLWPSEASLEALDEFAHACGLKRVWAGAGLNPMLGHALYVRDPAVLLYRQDEAEARLAEMAGALESERSAHGGASAELLEVRVQRAGFEERLSLAGLEIAALVARVAKLEALEQEIALQAQSLETQRLELLQQVSALEALREERDSLVGQKTALERALEEQRHSSTRRQQALETEMVTQAQSLETQRLELLQQVMALEALREEHAMLAGQHNVLQQDLAARVAEVASLKHAVQALEDEKAARRAAAVEDFRMARLHAQREAARQQLHEQTAAKAHELEARLVSLHQVMTLVSEQLGALKRLTHP